MQRWPVCILSLGFILLFMTVFIWIRFPSIVNSKIEQQLQLRNGSDTFEKWRNITIPIHIKFTFFNVTNPDEIVRGATPILNEVGPFVYKETRLKKIEEIDLEEDTVKFRQAITYYFKPELSYGSDETVLTILNIPLVSVARQASNGGLKGNTAAGLVHEFLTRHPEEQPIFIKRSVKELLFDGYYVPLMKHLADETGKELMPNNTFALYYGKNATFGTEFIVKSGIQSSSEFGQIVNWNEQKELAWWNDNKYCNQINGSDGSVFPPFFTRDRIVRIFSEDFCRSTYMTYQKDVEYMDLPGYRFTMPAQMWESGDENQENACFCTTQPGSTCSKTGTFSLSACKKGAPVVASNPYFLHGMEEDQKMYNMTPIADEHETYIDVEPRSGMVLRGRKMFQVNVELTPTKKVVGFKRIPKVLLPILWGEEFATTTPERAADLKFKLFTLANIVDIAKWCMLLASVALILYGFLLIKKSRPNKF